MISVFIIMLPDLVLIVYVCYLRICSQNKTLQWLGLDGNQIGDAGATSLGGALAYVAIVHFRSNVLLYVICISYVRFPGDYNGHYLRVFVSHLQPK